MNGLDIEKILSSVTERVAKNITNWWKQEVTSLGCAAKLSSSSFIHNGIEATVISLDVELTPGFSVSVMLNPRTGFVSVTMADFVHADSWDQNMILEQGLELATQLMNSDYNNIATAIQTVSLSVGLSLELFLALILTIFCCIT